MVTTMQDGGGLSPTLPRSFGPRYVLLREIGKGGMGRVFMSYSGGRVCALKMLHQDEPNQDVVRRFHDEAKLATELSHGNLVFAIESGTACGQHYLAMEYVRGKTLREVLVRCADRKRLFPTGLALLVAQEMLRALGYLHGASHASLVHRDVAPSNVMVAYDGGVKLIDFGLVKWRDRAGDTMTGKSWGQARYTSPEQQSGDQVDQRSDIFSVGVILWELLTGRDLFPKDGPRDPDVPLTPPSKLVPELPSHVDRVVMTALALKPADRYGSAQDFIADLIPHKTPGQDSMALEALLIDLFAEEIRSEAAEEARLLSIARTLVPKEWTGGERRRGISAAAAETGSSPQATTVAPKPVPARRRGARAAIVGVGVVLAVGGATAALRVWRSPPPRQPAARIMPTVTNSTPTTTRVAPEAGMAPVNASGATSGRKRATNNDRIRAGEDRDTPLITLPDTNPRAGAKYLLRRADNLFQNRQYTAATNAAEQALNEGGGIEARLLLGRIYLELGFREEALSHFSEALKLDPSNVAAVRGKSLAQESRPL
jgi:serine/threonine-protein kinase